jgi:hypothetical protein
VFPDVLYVRVRDRTVFRRDLLGLPSERLGVLLGELPLQTAAPEVPQLSRRSCLLGLRNHRIGSRRLADELFG